MRSWSRRSSWPTTSSGDVVVRLYESRGGRASATLTTTFDLTGADEVDLLERPLSARDHSANTVSLALRPFQILTLRLHR